MTHLNKITPADINMDLDAYSAQRPDIRKKMIEMKKDRRQAVGPAVMLYFENFETMRYQIQEMLFSEKGGLEQVEEEMAAFNPLVPNGAELVATMMLEYSDPDVRARELAQLGGIEECVTLSIEGKDGIEKIKATWEQDVDRTAPDGKTSSIHFLHFNFNDTQIKKFKEDDAAIIIAINHPHYGHMAIMPEKTRKSLAMDFKTT